MERFPANCLCWLHVGNILESQISNRSNSSFCSTVAQSLGMSISEVAGLCNYFGHHEDLEVQLCHAMPCYATMLSQILSAWSSLKNDLCRTSWFDHCCSARRWWRTWVETFATNIHVVFQYFNLKTRAVQRPNKSNSLQRKCRKKLPNYQQLKC